MRDFLVAVWRSTVRERSYALINLLGLALGFACALMLGLFLRGELTYDRHFDKHERIYRVVGETTIGEQVRNSAWIPRSVAPVIAQDHPAEVEDFVRFTDSSLQDGLRLRYGEKVLNWRSTYFASDSVFRVFSHKVLAGDPENALVEPSTVAVSASLARAYFGDADPIGQLLRTDVGEAWKITLVFEDLPPNTHLRYDALFADKIPILRDGEGAALRKQMLQGYTAYIYLLMRPGFAQADWKRIDADFVRRYVEPLGGRDQGFKARTWVQQLPSIHYGEPIDGDQPSGNRAYLYGCLTIALLILVVACINYTNLATARALRRARSTGIRKILGARRRGLLLEFLGESVLYVLAAAVLGFALAEVFLTLTPVNGLLASKVQLDLSSDPSVMWCGLAVALLLGVLAGAYPAAYLSSWLPVAAFSTRGGGEARGARMREALVLLQFVMAVGVVAATLVMGSQLHYMATAPLGFEQKNQVMLTIRGTDNFARIPALSQELLRNPGVLAVTQTGNPPGRYPFDSFFRVEDAKGAMQSIRGGIFGVSANFTAALGIRLLKGKNLSAESPKGNFLVNETMVRTMGWEDPIGRRIQDGRVVGVVRDFHFRPLREPVVPMLIMVLDDNPNLIVPERRPFVQRTLIVRVVGEDFAGTLKRLRETMTRFDPGNPFEYAMLDESLQGAYSTERRMLALIAIFASVCILIACLGLFGLTAFATERRSREIAIRKVLGASASQVVWMLSRRILLLIGGGGLMAAAVAWGVMNEWLSGFAYRVGVNPLLLAASIALAGGVALVTVALQSWRVARADPADTLRHD
jgi:putative ABC transport system permease protein